MDKGKLKKMIRDYGMENILGGGLAKILTALAERPVTLDVTSIPSSSVTGRSLENILELLGISQAEFDVLMAGGYGFLRKQSNSRQFIYTGNNLDENGYNGYNSATFFNALGPEIIEFIYNHKDGTWSINVSSL